MADFKTHITISTLLGVGYSAGAYFGYDLPLATCILSGGLASVSGMLPDVDSDSGVPLRESLAFAAAVVSMMAVHRFQQMGFSPEMIVLAGVAAYLVIRFGVGECLRRYTVHRGMFHSLPAALIAAEVAFLLSSGDLPIRYYKAGGVMLGYLSHLLLDELFAFKMSRGRLRMKQSFGTALKLFGHGWWPNISVYAKLAVLTWLVLYEPGWMARFRQQSGAPQQMAQQQSNVSPFQLPTSTAPQADTSRYR
jgi:membrane-bound metal-dependent hydrolase YbcI (DUF457 family)